MAEKKKDTQAADGRSEAQTNGVPPNEAETSNDVFDGATGAHSDELEQLRSQATEAQERYLRSQAELENTRKRLRREMDDERRYAELPLLADLLPVIDNVDRAIEAAEKNADAATLLAGFKMVSQQLNNVFDKHHCQPIQAEGQPFDPAVHQAIMQQSSADHPDNTVIAVGQNGYTLYDRVVRPAQVVVSKKTE
ncbi:MAG: nucleotide exchange factor GrpE [Pirellulales bacterium]